MTVPAEAAAAFPVCPGCDLPMHPSHLYEVGFNLVAAVAIVRFGRLVPVPGDLLKLYLAAAIAFRFLVEFVRANPITAFGLTSPQLVLIPLGVMVAWHFAWQVRRHAWAVPAAPPVAATSLAEG